MIRSFEVEAADAEGMSVGELAAFLAAVQALGADPRAAVLIAGATNGWGQLRRVRVIEKIPADPVAPLPPHAYIEAGGTRQVCRGYRRDEQHGGVSPALLNLIAP